MNAPNAITVCRVILVPVIVYLLYLPVSWAQWSSVGLFVVAMLSDVADGVIAKKREQITNFGTFLDPVADKMLILSMFLALSGLGVIPFWIALVILWRELLVTGIRSVASSKGVVVGANWMGKTKAVFQTATIIAAQLFLCYQTTGPITDDQVNFGGSFVTALATLSALLSVAFAGVFVYWNRALLFEDI
ncbi:MAG: CDP-diacylglycerol--glycerol-3-phosphate 3-phosphatidyltransferase [Candidatus Latescibacteria bacterium]|nr:CDP-diacylglycerol--glycerol-3-phosphate 3-phosphatidyltransferase [Candidatus Latescibacterota bacterium]